MPENMNEKITETADDVYAFEKMPVPKALAKFIVPTVMSQLAFLLLNLADAFFVGRTGDTYQISAMTITFPIAMMMACTATIFGTGGNSNIAACLGMGDRERAKKFATFSVYTAITVIAIYAVVIAWFQTPLLHFLGASEQSIEFCKAYLMWALMFSCVPLVFNQVISQLFLAEGESKIAGFGIALSAVLNIILDPIFIFPFGMGIGGAGAATCIANYIGFLYFLFQWNKRRQTTIVCLNIKNYQTRNGICAKTLAIGVPAGLVLLLTNICDFVRNYYLGELGSDYEFAAWGSVQKIGNALLNIAIGIAQGIRPLVAYNYAGKAFKRTKALVNGAVLTMLVYISLALVFVHLIPEKIILLFVTDKKAVEIAIYFLEVWTFSMIGLGFIELFNSIFQAFGKWKLSLANTIVNKGLLLTPVLMLLVNLYGIDGIPFSQVITENLTAIVLFIIYLGILRGFKQE